MVQAEDSIEMLARQNCASILLAYEAAAKSTALEKPPPSGRGGAFRNYLSPMDQLFKCKDCGRRFATFQALGGHRASHMKLRLPNNQDNAVTIAIPGPGAAFAMAPRPARFRVHECKECRERFPTGQALGGHMRKHAELSAKRKRADVEPKKFLEAPKDDCNEDLPISNESKKIRRVVLDLDLNFPPLEEDSLLKL